MIVAQFYAFLSTIDAFNITTAMLSPVVMPHFLLTWALIVATIRRDMRTHKAAVQQQRHRRQLLALLL